MADSRRTTLKKEYTAAIGNINWAKDHLTRVLAMYLEAVTECNEAGREIPENYIETGQAIEATLEGLEIAITIVTQLEERT